MVIPNAAQPHPVIPMKIGTDKPVVGATLVVARPRHQPVLIPICGLHKAMVIPNAAQPHSVIAMKIGTDKPVVGATLVVARPRHQPVSHPLMWPSQGHGDSERSPATPCHSSENRPRQTRRRGNPCGCPFPAPTRSHPLMWPSQGHGHSERSPATPCHCYENRPRQTRRRGNPCGCPFPAPTRFHPLMWPSQGHGDSERSAATPCHSYENRPRQTRRRGNPCGCPSRHQPVFIPLCGLRKAMVIPNATQPHPVIPNAAQPHPVIPNAAQPHPVIPNVAQRSEESKILVLENAPLDRTAQCPQANSPLPPSTPVGRATLVVALPHTQHLAPNTQNPLSHPYAILSTSSAFPHT